ncbi:MAG: outer membrane beta-barrel protein [Woeseiaceae bacterium]|nr:outer membrane beta-barrel protein [Woeseiaceae bacterium]
MKTILSWVVLGIALQAVPRVAVSDGGIYVGANIGSVQIEDSSTGYAVDDFASLTRLVVGLEVNRRFAFEGVYYGSEKTDPSVRFTAERADFRGFAVYAAGPVVSDYQGHLQVRLGLFTGTLDVDSTIGDFENDATGLALGAGYVYHLNDYFAIRGDLDTFISDFDRLTSLTIGVQLRFGD